MKLGYFSLTNISEWTPFVYDLAKGLEKKADTVFFIGQHSIDAPEILERQLATGFYSVGATIPFVAFRLGQVINRGYTWRNSLRLLLAKRSLNRVSMEVHPDVAYVEYLTAAILLREFLESKEIPYVVHVHGYDISSELVDPEYRKELQKVFKGAKAIIAASDYIKRLLILEGCSNEVIHVVRYGIDVDSIVPMSWDVRMKETPSVVFLGRLIEKKNPIALLHAFSIVQKEIPSAVLTIIGDGPLRNELDRRIEALCLQQNVSLLGGLPRSESFPILNRHWVYAQHSVTAVSGDKEGYAISPAEAAAHELPVVATLHNGIPEHVRDGDTGFLVAEFDYESMAERVIHLIKNPGVAKAMGEAGRKTIRQLNNPQVRVEKIFGILHSAATDGVSRS